MNNIHLAIIVATVYSLSVGQGKGQDKNAKTTKTLIGSWKFDYALYSHTFMGTTSTEKSQIFHTDTLQFFKDMTFMFRSHDTDKIDVRVHSGLWEVADNGKTLIHKNRKAQPPFVEQSPDLTFPIRIINKNRIRIDYTFLDQNVEGSKTSDTPVFFDRIE